MRPDFSCQERGFKKKKKKKSPLAEAWKISVLFLLAGMSLKYFPNPILMKYLI